MKFLSLLAVLALTACGYQEDFKKEKTTQDTEKTEIDKLKEQILQLSGVVSQVNAVVMSDYATCKTTPTDGGQTNDALIRKICEVAQASTVEAKVELKGQLSQFSNALENQIIQVQNMMDGLASQADVNQIKTDLYGTGSSCGTATAGSICVRVTTLETNVSTLQGQMTSAQNAITAIQGQLATLSVAVAGAMLDITIGNENLSAGPLYETVLRRSDRSRINAYIQAADAAVSLANNSLSVTNGSPTVTVTHTAHGYANGNVIRLYNLTTGRGIKAGSLWVDAVIFGVTANTFQYTANENATSTGTFGGANGVMQRINGRGLGQAWITSNGETSFTSTLGNVPYNFFVTGSTTTFTALPATTPVGFGTISAPGTGWICYSTAAANASLATIKAGGANIICK